MTRGTSPAVVHCNFCFVNLRWTWSEFTKRRIAMKRPKKGKISVIIRVIIMMLIETIQPYDSFPTPECIVAIPKGAMRRLHLLIFVGVCWGSARKHVSYLVLCCFSAAFLPTPSVRAGPPPFSSILFHTRALACVQIGMAVSRVDCLFNCVPAPLHFGCAHVCNRRRHRGVIYVNQRGSPDRCVPSIFDAERVRFGGEALVCARV